MTIGLIRDLLMELVIAFRAGKRHSVLRPRPV